MGKVVEIVKKKSGPVAGDPNKALTGKQKAFVEEYLVDLVGSKAAFRAGFSEKTARHESSRLLKMPHIKKAIAERQKEAADSTYITPEWVLKKIATTIASAEKANKHNEVLRGCELLGRHHSLFVDRTEISGHDGDAIALKKVEEDVESFTSSIAGLAARSRKTKEA